MPREAFRHRCHAVALINLCDGSKILGAHLLADAKHPAEPCRQGRHGRRDHLAKDVCPLAAAQDQQLDGSAGFRHRVACIGEREDRRPHRIAGMDGAEAVGSAQTGNCGKRGSDLLRLRRE